MDEIRCEITIEDRAEGEPARLVGVLMPYNTEARDRREVFETGSSSWDPKGIVVNRMHQRSSPIMRVVPIESEGALDDRSRATRYGGWSGLCERGSVRAANRAFGRVPCNPRELRGWCSPDRKSNPARCCRGRCGRV